MLFRSVVGDGEELARVRALESMSLASASEREALGARGRAVVLARFRRERSAAIVSELLERVARVRTPAADACLTWRSDEDR